MQNSENKCLETPCVLFTNTAVALTQISACGIRIKISCTQNHGSNAYSVRKKQASVLRLKLLIRQTFTEGMRVLWKESAHRFRRTSFDFAESFDEPAIRFSIYFHCCAFWNVCTQISRLLEYGVRISSKASATAANNFAFIGLVQLSDDLCGRKGRGNRTMKQIESRVVYSPAHLSKDVVYNDPIEPLWNSSWRRKRSMSVFTCKTSHPKASGDSSFSFLPKTNLHAYVLPFLVYHGRGLYSEGKFRFKICGAFITGGEFVSPISSPCSDDWK